jgi:hypothetical protein
MAKVVLGFFSFTEITDPSEHRSYNEWHQLDHMPEQFPLPGVAFGQRWVSTPPCRRARAYDGAGLGPVHYITLYLMGEPVDATLEAFGALGARLQAEGRFHQHRRSHLSGPMLVSGMQAAPRVVVSAEAVPYRPNRGAYVVVRAAGDPGEDERLAGAFVAQDGVAGAWTFATDARFAHHPWRPGHKTITVCYLDGEPLTLAPALGGVVRAEVEEGHRDVLWAGPVATITPWCWDWFDEA